MGDGQYDSHLTLDTLSFDTLALGRNSFLDVGLLKTSGGDIIIADGGKLNLKSGDIGSASDNIGTLSLLGGSTLEAPASIYAAGIVAVGPETNQVSATNDITVANDISEGNSLVLAASGDISANSISASSIAAKNVEVRAGALNLSGDPSSIEKDLTITGDNSGQSAGNFTSLEVGQTFTLSGASIAGDTLKAGTIIAGGDKPAMLAVNRLEEGSAIGAGANAFLVFGEGGSSWLDGVLSARGGSNGALGIYSPIVIGNGGLTLDRTQSAPTLAAGELNFAPDSLLVVKGENAWEEVNPQGAISAQEQMEANVRNGASLALDGVAANKVYVVLGNNIATSYESSAAWDDSKVETGSHLIGVKKLLIVQAAFSLWQRTPVLSIHPWMEK